MVLYITSFKICYIKKNLIKKFKKGIKAIRFENRMINFTNWVEKIGLKLQLSLVLVIESNDPVNANEA